MAAGGLGQGLVEGWHEGVVCWCAVAGERGAVGEAGSRASAPIFSSRRPGPATASSALGSTTPKGARSTSCTAAPRTAEGVQSA
eukprot:scaffold1198_cov116-Isochrysis_galbana.AAC.5